MDALLGNGLGHPCLGKRRYGVTGLSNCTNRNSLVSGSRKVHSGLRGNQHTSLRRCRWCCSLGTKGGCRQQKHRCYHQAIYGDVLHQNRSVTRSSNLDWTANVFKHAIISKASASLQSVKMSAHSGSDGDTEAALSIKSRKNPVWAIFDNFSNVFRADELGLEIWLIALPAMLALAADPLASLVDTAFIGRIGPVELAAVGVSISVFNLVSKVFNVPLLNVTTSFVAEAASEESSVVNHNSVPLLPTDNGGAFKDMGSEIEVGKKLFIPAASSALVLGTALGVGEACILTFLAGPVLTVMGVGVTSPMRIPAVQYLALRALGAPAVVVSLATQGIFRGFKDTKTPLYASVAGNLVNIVLDPILMFSLNFGVGGAAVATVVSQYIIAGLLLWNLDKRVVLIPPRLGDMNFDRFLTSGGLLLGRTIALLVVMTLATSMAARQGAIPMAAHQIGLQIWLAASLLSDSLALAGQAIVAEAFAKHDYKRLKEAAFRVLQIGGSLGMLLALVLSLGVQAFSTLFTNDAGVLSFIAIILPFIVLTQPITALAFVFDGLHYGASDFAYAAVFMIIIAVPSMLSLYILPKFWGIAGVWVGLTVVMSLRMLAGFWRLGSSTGPWQVLSQDAEISESKL